MVGAGDDTELARHRFGHEGGVEAPIGETQVEVTGLTEVLVEIVVVGGLVTAERTHPARSRMARADRVDGVEDRLLVGVEQKVHGQPFGNPRCWRDTRLSWIS